MSFLDYFRATRKPTSAQLAKERLKIIVAHERSGKQGLEYLPQLEQELLEVVRKYVKVSDDAVKVNLDRGDNCEVMEVNITLPDSH